MLTPSGGIVLLMIVISTPMYLIKLNFIKNVASSIPVGAEVLLPLRISYFY